MSLQKAEDEFLRLQQAKMRVLEYASKFIEFFLFAPTYVADERLKMIHFVAGLNLGLKEKMAIRQYISYEDMYDTAVNVERATKEKNGFYSE